MKSQNNHPEQSKGKLSHRKDNPICNECERAMVNLYYHTSRYDKDYKWKNRTINVKTVYWICLGCNRLHCEKDNTNFCPECGGCSIHEDWCTYFMPITKHLRGNAQK